MSVVIPTHRRPQLLERAVRSVLAQTSAPLETIVVDDAADGDTAAVVRDLRDAHGLDEADLRYEAHPGVGASASRNHGVALARGATVALLDDDDVWSPAYLSTAIDRLSTAGVDAVVTWRAGTPGETTRRYPNPAEGLVAGDVVVRNPGVVGSNICVRRATYLALGGFDEGLPVSNDIDFFVRFLQVGRRYEVVAQPLVLVGSGGGPRLTDPDRRRIAGLCAYARKHRDAMSPSQRLEMRRRIARAKLRHTQLDDGAPWVRRTAAGLGFVALTRPRDVGGVGRVVTRLRGAASRVLDRGPRRPTQPRDRVRTGA